MATIIARALDQCSDLIGSVTSADLGRPTPCAEWDVADLCDHLVASVAGMATMARGGQPDWAAGPHHDDPVPAFREQAAALLDAVRTSESFPLGMAAGELAIHAFDLAVALGRNTAELDQEVAEEGYAFMGGSLRDETRGDAFGPAVPAPEGADAYQRLAAFAGRSVAG